MIVAQSLYPKWNQPPLGGCVLKQENDNGYNHSDHQPPLGGCVLKLCKSVYGNNNRCQPPLGGCVLKHTGWEAEVAELESAASRRLCVETE